jgi:lipopolysaccharide/colanic/teichoic acid biosynthesis glycosyltransferase
MPLWKRFVDIAGAGLGLVLLSPVFLLTAVLIKLVSPGPVFFAQTRLGYRGKPFKCLKFRTMRVGESAAVHQRHLSKLIRGDQPMRKLDAGKDPRLIPCGGFLRAAALDELPQLLNVLRGDMSLVGPRPCLPYEAREYRRWHRQRLDTAPGMTGLWQVSGKNGTTFTEMVRLDVRYAGRLSLPADVGILLRTIPAIVGQVAARRRSGSHGEAG